MSETGRGHVRVFFTQEGLARGGLSENGHPYPGVEWKIDGGTLFMKFVGASASGKAWDYIFGPAKWVSMELLD